MSNVQSPTAFLRPAYAEAFQCIASACEDTCCQGWSVPIDQATYEKYRTLDQTRPHLGTLIVLKTANATPADYARIPLKADTSCGFLDSDRLCGIHKQLGPEALSHTCATYPRAVSTVAGTREEALNLSCPEAARLTLLNPRLLSASSLFAPRPAADQGRLALRDFTLRTLANRSEPLWQRLHRLGSLALRIDLLRGNTPAGVWADVSASLIPQLLAEIRNSPVPRTLEQLRPQPAQQLQFVMEALRQRLAQPPAPARFFDCVSDFEGGLGTATARNEFEILTAFDRGNRFYLQPMLRKHPHLLENYLSNAVIKTGYPFGTGSQEGRRSAASEHLLLCLQLAMLQTMLVGVAGQHRESFALTHVIKLVQSFARTFEHSTQALNELCALAHTRSLDKLSDLSLLLQLEPVAERTPLKRHPAKVGAPIPVLLPPPHAIGKLTRKPAYRPSGLNT